MKIILVAALAALAGCAIDPSQRPEVRRLSAISQLTHLQLSVFAKETAYFIDRYDAERAKDASMQSVRSLLKDPESANFRNVNLASIDDGIVFCGEVNSKNSYGGYVGYTWFVAGVNGAQIYQRETRSNMASEAAARNAGIAVACKKY